MSKELEDLTNRAILKAYRKAEIEREYEAVHKKLEKRYPSLQGLIEKVRNKDDPITEIEELKSKVTEIESIKPLVGLVTLFKRLVRYTDRDFSDMEKMFDKLELVCDLCKKHLPILEQLYINVVKAVKEVASAEGIQPEELVKNQNYRDEVTRRIFPRREDAERHEEIVQKVAIEMVNLGKFFIDIAKKTGKVTGKDLEEGSKLILTEEAFEALTKAMLEYNKKEFDRIYSTGQ